jgi:sugar/nucleoside kinase (ribokinase family)
MFQNFDQSSLFTKDIPLFINVKHINCLRRKSLDLLAIGGITLDHIFKVSRLPKTHFEAQIFEFGTFFGGRAPNVAAMAAKIGLKTGIVSAVGEDFLGSGYEAHLRKLRVDLRGVIKVSGQRTKEIFIFSDPKGKQITFFYFGAERHFRKMEVPIDLIKESNIVHISSSGDYKFNINCANVAHSNNVLVSFDAGNDPFTEIPEYLKGVISRTYFLFMNDVEVPGILKRLELRNINELLTYGPSIIAIINKQDKSSRIYTKRTVEIVPSAVKEIVDITGASDGYAAGFLTGYTKTRWNAGSCRSFLCS